MPYRQDIDFLRAISVIIVILYHLNLNLFSGGFVGVDVFFVISGFLITKILVSEIDSKGKINYFEFFSKRIRRIYPALISTIFLTLVAGFLLFSPEKFQQLGASSIHALLSISNIYFYYTTDYFNSDVFSKPILHTWSLGVEEQFYLIWPIFIFFVWKIPYKKISLFVILFFLFVSFFSSLFVIYLNQQLAFYISPLRFYEFLIGAILAAFPLKNNYKIGKISFLFYLIGLFLIIFSAIYYNSQTLFPGFYSLAPCIGAFLCLRYGSNINFDKSFLSCFIYIGKISFSLYLLHWPVIIFYKSYYSINNFSTVNLLIICLIFFILSIFQYHFIETKFRYVINNKISLVFISLFSLILIYVSASIWANDGYTWRNWVSSSDTNQAELLKKFDSGKDLRFSVRRKICEIKGWDKCDLPELNKFNVLVIGDSHAVDGLNAFESIFPNFSYSLSELGGCPPYYDIKMITPSTHPNREKCKKLNDNYRFNKDYIKSFDLIIISNLYGWYKVDYLIDYLKFLHSIGVRKVIIFGNYFVLNESMYEIINRYGYNSSKVMDRVIESQDFTNTQISKINKYGYLYLSKKDLFCIGSDCKIFDENNVPFTYDEHHLSYEFAYKMLLSSKSLIANYLSKDESSLSSFLINETRHEINLNILGWGPQEANFGQVPNKQPNGDLGIWIKVNNTSNLEGATLFFNGKQASGTYIFKNLITASIPPSELTSVGEKEILIKFSTSPEVIRVGTFIIRK